MHDNGGPSFQRKTLSSLCELAELWSYSRQSIYIRMRIHIKPGFRKHNSRVSLHIPALPHRYALSSCRRDQTDVLGSPDHLAVWLQGSIADLLIDMELRHAINC